MIAFGQYTQHLDKLQNYIRENSIYLYQKINIESRNKGLLITEAYYGLDEHIYLVDAGMLMYKPAEEVKEYYDQQLIPIKKKLQLMVEDS